MSAWTPSPTYWVGSVPRERHQLSTSPTEILHLTISFLVLTLDLALVEGVIRFGVAPGGFYANEIAAGIGFALAAAATGFIAHEMAHKIVAQRYGFWAEFRMSVVGLLVSLATAWAGFLFAAPGATVVSGMGDVREWGRTSLAGPALNLVEASAFFAGSLGVWYATGNEGIWAVLLLLSFFNGYFAAFNLLPLGPLDGAKVWRWSRPVWIASFAISAVFTVTMFLLLGSSTPPY